MSCFMCGRNSPDCLLAVWNTCLAQPVPRENGTQLVWLGPGLNRPRRRHQRSRSSHTRVNCAHTRETDWNLPDPFPIKSWMTLRQIKGWCCFVRWVSMSNEKARARHSTSYFKSQFSCRRTKGSICRELIVGCRRVGLDKCIYSCANALAMHSLILNTVAEGCNMKTQGSERSMLSTSAERRGDCSAEQSSFSVIWKTEDD